MSNNTQKIAKNTFYMFLRMVIVLCVGLFTSRVILQTLGVEDFGVYNVVGGIVVLFSFLQQALTNASLRFLSFDLGLGQLIKLQHTFAMIFNIHVILAIIVLLLCELIGLWFLNFKLSIPEERLFAANIAFQFSIFSTCVVIIRHPFSSAIISHEQMNFFAYSSIVEVILKLIIVYILVIFSYDKLILYSILLFGINLLMSLWFYLYCKKRYTECSIKKYWNKEQLKEMLGYSGWSLLVNGTDVSVNQSLVFFFNIFFGVITNAALGIANQVNSYLCQFLNSFTQAYNPQIIKSYASGDREFFLKIIFSSSKISFYLMFLMSIPLLLNINYILDLWLDVVPDKTGSFLIMIVMFSLVDAYSAPLWTSVYATGNLKWHQIIMASIKVLNIPLAYVLLSYGAPAVIALALKAGLNVICSIVRPIYVKSLFALPLKEYFISVFAKVYLVFFLCVPLPLFISSYYEDGFNKLLLTSITFYFISFIVIYYIGLNKNEQVKLMLLIKKRFHT